MTQGEHIMMSLVNDHEYVKNWLRMSGMSDSMLHIVLGVAITAVTMLVFHRNTRWYVLLMPLIVINFLNEWLDRIFYGSWRWVDTSRDFRDTLLAGACFLLVATVIKRGWRVPIKIFRYSQNKISS